MTHLSQPYDDWDQLEYKEALASIRHYSNVRFASLTVFLASTSGMFFALTRVGEDAQGVLLTPVILLSGLVVTCIFGSMDILVTAYISSFSNWIGCQPRVRGFWLARPLARSLAHRPAWCLYMWFIFVWSALMLRELNRSAWLASRGDEFPAGPVWLGVMIFLLTLDMWLWAWAFRNHAFRRPEAERRAKGHPSDKPPDRTHRRP